MDKIKAFLAAHFSSWTVGLGFIAGLLVVAEQYLPTLQAAVHAIWPAGDAYLVVAAMYIGRAVGFVKAISAATTPAA